MLIFAKTAASWRDIAKSCGGGKGARGMRCALAVGMSDRALALKTRIEDFAVNVVKFCDTLGNSIAARRIAEQLIDASTSVAANYRAACRAYTRPLFISKLAIAGEEADESELWLRMLRRAHLRMASDVEPLEREAYELTAILTASLRTARGQRGRASERSEKCSR